MIKKLCVFTFSLLLSNIALAYPKANSDVIALLKKQVANQTQSYIQVINQNVFNSQIENLNDENNVKSIVFITSKQFGKSGFTGSGVLVKKNNTYKILTARHIALTAQANPDINVYIFNIYGNPIGELNAHNISEIDYTNFQKTIETDSAIVDIKNINLPELKKIKPAKLANYTNVIQTTIKTSGISQGISGGAVFNNKNEVVGIVSKMSVDQNDKNNTITTGELLKTNLKLKMINPILDNQSFLSILVIQGILFKYMYKNVTLLISPVPDTPFKSGTEMQSIIGFPNMIANIYHIEQ